MEEIAVIDLGYNSIRLSLFQRNSRNSFRTLGSMKNFTRLGEGVDEGGDIKEDKVQNAEKIMAKFRDVLERRGIETVYPLGTSAFRLARNGEEVAKRLSKSLGWDVEILPGEEEGRLAALGALNSLPFSDGIIFELGGGSLEIAYVKNRSLGKIFHFPLGALRLTKLYKNQEEMRKEIRGYLYSLPIWIPPTLIGSGGNVRSVGRFIMQMDNVKFNHVHGYVIPRDKISSLAKSIWTMNPEEIASFPGIGKERALTVKASLLVMEELTTFFDSQNIMVSEFGMREGKIMRGEEISLIDMRNSWLWAMADFMNLKPPSDIWLEAEKITGSELAGISAYISHLFKEAGWGDPFDTCYKYLLKALVPGFSKRDLGLISAICKGASSKVKKKDLQKLGIGDTKLDKVREMSKEVKKVVKMFPIGVY
ncbi:MULTISPECIES: Ppx/GppA phosphatase family protein [Acidianus]|uniref:Phosphatase n=1 Tax=Candidatus Acidianus copahuensis TaxID=1160895 RepID=A0A031LU14_9CREN|nr:MULTISPECIES: Ppx/GppA phosphatase family protein [Acidianus]EZQ10598.1 phosphatase [Candidatus Acidianus copahuensis]NON63144.1 Ppx/GppA family phosphatase [Acidianus sp. RZ1]